jgi:hypothetical protein
MLASITPLGERGRRTSWRLTASMHVLGSLLGGAAVGALTGLLGYVALSGVALHARLAVLGAAIVTGIGLELGRERLPGPRRQVDERWLDRYRGWVYGLGYGAQLGTGLVTVIVSSAVYIVPLAALLSADPLAGTLIGGVAGALRGLTVLSAVRVTTPARLVAFHSRMRLFEAPVRTASLLVQTALVAAAAVAVAS